MWLLAKSSGPLTSPQCFDCRTNRKSASIMRLLFSSVQCSQCYLYFPFRYCEFQFLIAIPECVVQHLTSDNNRRQACDDDPHRVCVCGVGAGISVACDSESQCVKFVSFE